MKVVLKVVLLMFLLLFYYFEVYHSYQAGILGPFLLFMNHPYFAPVLGPSWVLPGSILGTF